MMKQKTFALFVIVLLLQQSLTIRIHQEPLYATLLVQVPHIPQLVQLRAQAKAASASRSLDDPDWGKISTFSSAAEPALKSFNDMKDFSTTLASATKFLKVFQGLGSAFAALGAITALIDIFNPQPDPLEQVMQALQDMEERIMNAMNDHFAFLKNDNLKNLYNTAERHINDASQYLHRMTEAKNNQDQGLYDFFSHNFKERMELSAIDDLEAILSITSEGSYFISEPFFKSLIDANKGDNRKIAAAIQAVTSLTIQAFLNLHVHFAEIDPSGNLGKGLAKYQDEAMEKLSTYLRSLDQYQKDELKTYLDANLRSFMEGNCKPMNDREGPCATAINKELDEAYGNVFKFTTFCFNKDLTNDYKGIDMFYVKDVYNMECAVFWSTYEDSDAKADLTELQNFANQGYSYLKLEDWDQYVIAPRDGSWGGWAGFASTYISFDTKKSTSTLAWGRYRKAKDGVCRINIIDADNDQYNRDDILLFADQTTKQIEIPELVDDLNDDVWFITFYGKACDSCSVNAYEHSWYNGNVKTFYPVPSVNGLTNSKTGYEDKSGKADTYLLKASSLKVDCEAPPSVCKIIFGDNDGQDHQDTYEFSLNYGESRKENLSSDLNDNVSWLKFLGNCEFCRVYAYSDSNWRGEIKFYAPNSKNPILTNIDSFLNNKISSFIAECKSQE